MMEIPIRMEWQGDPVEINQNAFNAAQKVTKSGQITASF
jgi:hypothetical protein